MSNDIKLQSPELFTEISAPEQEAVSGGLSSSNFAFYLQMTKIVSLANNKMNYSDGGNNISVSSDSSYTLSQLTIGLNPSFFGNSRNRGRNSSLNSLLRFLFVFMNS
ncbi:hypothetical protein [Nostoc sp. T09]|uniref:hypothetical protein n=1 Tax=Nostoc sp. T09 TaxID=1932621 RepID=UPI00117E921D|nr:hypothetical protein [Nostoc sp. T09]